jgi:hypothetical protein
MFVIVRDHTFDGFEGAQTIGVRSETSVLIHLEPTRNNVSLYTDEDSDHANEYPVTSSRYSNTRPVHQFMSL